MSKIKVTIWKRFDDRTRRFEHNHIEDGWVPAEQRAPVSAFPDVKKDWQNGLWVHFRGWLYKKSRRVTQAA